MTHTGLVGGVMVNMFDGEDRILLKSSDLDRWKEEKSKLKQQADSCLAKIAEIDRKLKMASELLGAAVEPENRPPDSQEPQTMVKAAEVIIEETGEKWLENSQIIKKLRKNPSFAEKMSASPNYYYTMMARLVKRGIAEKKSGKYRKKQSAEDILS